MNMGLVYAMQGDEEQAVMRGRQAMALYPLAKNVINAQRIHIQMGSIYLQLGEVDKCIELLKSLKDKPLGMEIGELENRCHVGSGEGSRNLQGDRPVSKPWQLRR